ncbi:hypothetical protein KW794_02170, partial [Candidatus Saccharibacteria bacterium]|nr:hypothetical protein [Candidatus Saccharibacteria bacterium]
GEKKKKGLVEEEENLRRRILLTRQSGVEIALPSDLFPPKVFNLDGSRKMDNGRHLMTDSEQRAYFELQDGHY